MAILGDMNIVLDTNSTDKPVPIQSIHVNILLQIRVLEEWFNNETAEVDLHGR